MIMTNKLLPVAVIAALLGGSIAALVMHRSQPVAAGTTAQGTASNQPAATAQPTDNQMVPVEFRTAAEVTAYKMGFADGFGAGTRTPENRALTTGAPRAASGRVVSRNVSSRTSARRVYYDYSQPSGRSFWDKHRDKLTVAIGAGAGAAIGGLIGGKKGAAIGALSGAGGSALYTYKLRKRNGNN